MYSVWAIIFSVGFSVGLFAQIKPTKQEKKVKEKPSPLTSHVVVLAIDGLRIEDLNNPKFNLPTLKTLRNRGSLVLNLESVYPSQSIPAHATIVTGMLPSDHGVIANSPFDEKRGKTSSEKYHVASDLKADTIWQAARRSGLKTASVNFPLTETAEIDFFAKDFNSIPNLIEKNRPQLLLVKFDEVASSLQRFGVGSVEARNSLETADAAIKKILDSIEQAGLINETAFLLISSHGYANADQEFRPNVILARKGFLTTDATGNITSWIAAAYSSGGAAAIYLHDPNNTETAKVLEEIFAEIQQKDASPIWRILSRKDATKLGADPRAAIFIEAAPGFVISDQAAGKKLTDKLSPSAGRAHAGYLPSRSEMRGMLIGVGKGFKPQTQIEYARLVDIAPTIARLLGLEMKTSRGHAISAILAQ